MILVLGRILSFCSLITLSFSCGTNPKDDSLDDQQSNLIDSIPQKTDDARKLELLKKKAGQGNVYKEGEIPRHLLLKFGEDITVAASFELDIPISAKGKNNKLIGFLENTDLLKEFNHINGEDFFNFIDITDNQGNIIENEIDSRIVGLTENRYVSLAVGNVPFVGKVLVPGFYKIQELKMSEEISMSFTNWKPIHVAILNNLISMKRLRIEGKFIPTKTGYKLTLELGLKLNQFKNRVSVPFIHNVMNQYLILADKYLAE